MKGNRHEWICQLGDWGYRATDRPDTLALLVAGESDCRGGLDGHDCDAASIDEIFNGRGDDGADGSRASGDFLGFGGAACAGARKGCAGRIVEDGATSDRNAVGDDANS